MTSLHDLRERYGKKSFNELVSIAQKDINELKNAFGYDQAGSVSFIVAFSRLAHFADWKISRREHEFFVAVTGINLTYEQIERVFEGRKNKDNDLKVIREIKGCSLRIQCLFVELCLCVCACDGDSLYEFYMLADILPSEAVLRLDEFIESAV